MAILERNDTGAVAHLHMNAPDRLNAMSDEMLAALMAQFDTLAEQSEIRAVIVSGAGKAFCAGHDLKEMTAGRQAEDGGQAYFADLFDRCAQVMMRIRTLPQPVIAQVHGIATAAGCQLVASCDLAIAADNTRFGVNGVNIGLFCSTPMVALSRNIPRKQAFEMLTTGQFINAVAATGAYEEVHGVDPSRFKKYLEFGGPIVRGNASVGDLPFPDDHFDVVTCMEVLEHVPDEVLVSGLAELRRVCAGQLIMSVPFEEPEPIYDGHCRRFTGADVAHHFPDATRVLLFRSLAPWAVVEEWCGTAEKSPSDASLEQAAGRHGSSLGVVRATRAAVRMQAAASAHRFLRRIRSVRGRLR